ncbi:MAG: phosphoenolpyruvate carboxykinase (ATP) [Oligoflexus sp.]
MSSKKTFDLHQYEIYVDEIYRNCSPALLYEMAVNDEAGTMIANNGALVAYSGEKTGRSPKDKRIVERDESKDDIWWGDINMPINDYTFQINRERALDFFNSCQKLFVVDAFAGWDPKNRIKIRVICSRPYHALFMHNMLIRPTTEELENYGEPDYVIFNAGSFPANRLTMNMSSKTSIALCFERREFVILGTQYAGEMKKGVFTIMNYIMPKKDIMTMHCSANEGRDGDVSLFFGLSGTGKTTLSADPARQLIGDDEHGWSDNGIFNIEGGCYAKCINLSESSEPEIYRAIRFGALLENVTLNPRTREVNFDDSSITENTRASYPITHMDSAKIPCVGQHPNHIIFLTADAFGVLPPVSKLTPEQAMYHFISGYTAKVAGTEVGIKEPQATFSSCFGAAFMVWHPSKYAELLSKKIKDHGCQAWLVNTGWISGPYGKGRRIPLAWTRSIIQAIHSGELEKAQMVPDEYFGLQIPTRVGDVPAEILNPQKSWENADDYHHQAMKLVKLFHQNFETFKDGCSPEIISGGPKR